MQKQRIEELLKSFVDRSLQLTTHKSYFFAKGLGLNIGQLSVLNSMARMGACPVGDVARQYDISNAAASQMLDRLVQLGYIHRAEDAEDRRVRLHNLSPKGKKLVMDSAHARTEWVEGLTSELSAEQIDSIIPALEVLWARIQATNTPAEIKHAQTR